VVGGCRGGSGDGVVAFVAVVHVVAVMGVVTFVVVVVHVVVVAVECYVDGGKYCRSCEEKKKTFL
jgi:hypothetical protein